MKKSIFDELMRSGEIERMFKDNKINEFLNSGQLSENQLKEIREFSKKLSQEELERRQYEVATLPGWAESQLTPVIKKVKEQQKPAAESKKPNVEKVAEIMSKKTTTDTKDITKGLSKRKSTAKPAAATPNTAKKVGNVNTGFYADAISASKPKLRSGDSAANIGAKIYAVMKQDNDERKLRSELTKNREEENFEKEKARHEELIKAIKKAKEGPVEPPKGKKGPPARDAKGRFVKQEPTKPGAPAPAAKPAPKPTEAPKPAPKPAETPAPKPAEAPKPAPKPAEAPTAKPAPEAPAAPTATKPPPTPKIPSAVKAGAAVVGAVAGYELAKSIILKHEGSKNKPYKDSLGLWTVGVGHLIGDGKSLPKEYDRTFSDEEIQALYEEDFKKHKVAAEKIPGFNNLNEKGQTALIDLTFNMGPVWYKKWPTFTKQLEAGDIEGAAKNLEGSTWYKQVKSRGPEVVALLRAGKKETTSDATTTPTTGSKISADSVENKDLKGANKGTNVVVDNTKTTVVSPNASPPQTIRSATPSEKPAIIGG